MKYAYFIILVLMTMMVVAQRESLNSKISRFDSIVEQEMENWNVAGAAVAIVKGDEVIYNKGFGFGNLKGDKKITVHTLFAMGSSAKAFTGALVAQFDTDTILSLNQPVSEQVSITFPNSYLTEKITFRDLLTHSTGIPGHDFVWLSQDLNRDSLWEIVQYLPPSAQFRETFLYNNILYSIAGYAAARLNNSSWEESIDQMLFQPLEMNETQFEIPSDENSDDYAIGFIHQAGFHNPLPFRKLKSITPAGGVYTTTTDLSKWIKMLLQKGYYKDEKILDSVSIKKMFSPYVVSNFPKKFPEHFFENYGLGWMITSYRGHLHVHHAGNIDGFTSTVDLWPEDEIGIVILTNNLAANTFTDIVKYKLADHLLDLEKIDWNKRYKELKKLGKQQKVEGVPKDSVVFPISLTPDSLKDYTGTYSHKAYGTLEIRTDGEKLKGKYEAFPISLEPRSRDVFIENTNFKGQQLIFIRDGENNISGLKSQFPSSHKEIEFEKIK